MTAAALVGVQEPRFLHSPDNVVENRAEEAIELMAAMGQPLDPWQCTTLRAWLGVAPDGSWAATKAAVVVARQNGKNSVLEARELAGLFLFGERRIVHSAHSADTAREAYKRMVALIESTPWLEAEVKQMPKSPTAGIILKNGAELSYRTRTKGVRGFSAPVVVLDEAQELTGDQHAAIEPLVSSFGRRQLIYTGTVLPTANIFKGVVTRGRTGSSASLGYGEWSAPEDFDPHNQEQFVQGSLMANPSVGFRMTFSAIQDEWESAVAGLTEDKFLQERWSVWPAGGGASAVIPGDAWAEAVTEWRPQFNVQGGHVAIGRDFGSDYAVVAYALRSPEGVFVEAIAQTGDVDPVTGFVREGVDWVVPYTTELYSRRLFESVVVDKAGPAFAFVNGLIAAGLPVSVASFEDWKSACAQFVDELVAGRIRHSGQPQVSESAQGVLKRRVGDTWVYDRKTPKVRVAPVEAVTLAAWGVTGTVSPPSKYEQSDLLVL